MSMTPMQVPAPVGGALPVRLLLWLPRERLVDGASEFRIVPLSGDLPDATFEGLVIPVDLQDIDDLASDGGWVVGQ